MQILIQKNTRLLKLLFLLLLAVLFLASCRSSKNISSGTNGQSNKEALALKEKYAIQLGVQQKDIDNIAMLKFIDEWYSVPYKYGGRDKTGIDCSAFSSELEKNVFNKIISGSAQGLYDLCKETDMASLKEGDLVFFKIDGKRISHVGVYIMNNKFVHATTKKGVMINDLGEPYYKKYFYRGGRLRDEL